MGAHIKVVTSFLSFLSILSLKAGLRRESQVMLLVYPSAHEANQCRLLRMEKGSRSYSVGGGNLSPPQTAARLKASAI